MREVAQLGNVDELVVDHRRAGDDAVARDPADLGEAVDVEQLRVDAGLDECAHLGGQRCGADEPAEHPTAEHIVAQLGLRDGVGVLGPLAFVAQPVHPSLITLKQHVDYPGHHRQLCGPDQAPVLEQGGQIAFGNEIAVPPV